MRARCAVSPFLTIWWVSFISKETVEEEEEDDTPHLLRLNTSAISGSAKTSSARPNIYRLRHGSLNTEHRQIFVCRFCV